ncbi:MAG: L-ribulose-5-phosphate 4-epimerase AraD [Treponema sp.]|nr:L-ribulose-5-phosphate 4-epimerase AraD [Treponema sp.]
MANPYQTLKDEAYEANREIPAHNLAVYTWGNVSAFDKARGVFAIKPSGVPYPELTSNSMVVVDIEGRVVEGTLRPSSDTPTHVVLYREFAVNGDHAVGGIIHTHSPFAVGWAQAVRDVPLFGTTHADHIQTAIPCTPYLSKEAVERDYETETGNLIVEQFRARGYNPGEVNMVLVGGHGPFAWGETAAKAVYHGVVIEEICKMALNTICINPATLPLPDYIIRKHYERKHGPNAYYGQ